MSDERHDVLVIGAGPGGYPAAIRAAQLGLKTACVEKENLGGVCLNWGCIPSKALLKTAELAHQVRDDAEGWGLSTGELSIDYGKVIARSRKVADKFVRGVRGLFKKYGVTHLRGTATIAGPGTVQIEGKDGGTVQAKHVIVATGGRAKTFPGIEPDGERILTYREAILATELPPSITVLGAGAIGMEFAYFWNAMGAQVTVVEALPEVLPLEDPECAAVVRKAMNKHGIGFQLGKRVEKVERDGEQVVTRLEDGTELRSHTVLVALGVRPNTEGIGLEDVGVELERGFVKVDASYRTTASGFYAVGDVCSLGPALAHTATRQAHVCVERIAGEHPVDVDYDAMPSCTYCQPQVASVGLTAEQAKERGYDVQIGQFPFLANGKAYGAGHREGFVKVVLDKKYGEVLGAHIVGAEATEMIAEMVLARTAEATAAVLTSTVHAHPTFAEAMYEAVASALGESVHI